MKPFRTSLTARLVSFSISLALAGTGVAALTHSPDLVPYVIVLAVVGCVLGVILGAFEHTGASAALGVALPILLFPYVMVAELALRAPPSYGWAFIAAGALMAASTVLASFVTRRESAHVAQPIRAAL
jgi:hypothetical protein